MIGPQLGTGGYTFVEAIRFRPDGPVFVDVSPGDAAGLRPPPRAIPPVPVDTHNPAVAVQIIVNYERSRVGAGPLAIDPLIASAASGHSSEMAAYNRPDHRGADGSSPADRMRRHNVIFGAAGEVIAAGYQGYLTVVAGWMNSPPHRKIILDPAYRRIGVGVAIGNRMPKYPYWTADLAD
jgi:uncharacterized protein YkwD